MEILEKMLQIEVDAKQIVENAKIEADKTREKAREEAEQLVTDGKRKFQERLRQDLVRIEDDAETRKKAILQEAEVRLAEIERIAKERMEKVVERTFKAFLENILAK